MKKPFTLPNPDTETIESLVKIYSGPEDHYSHRIRFALKVKGVRFQQENISANRDIPEELKLVNPLYETRPVPTLIDRDLVIYEPNIILSYIDERFPSPPLIPSIAKERARIRMLLWKIESSIVEKAQDILDEKNNFKAMEISKVLRNTLVNFSIDYLIDDENESDNKITMQDCVLAPILCRLPLLGINLQSNVLKYKPLHLYMRRIFSSSAFITSCSNEELSLLTN